MKKSILFFLIFWGLVNTIIAQEQKTISRFEGDKITGIEVRGAFQITVKQGTHTGASVNIPSRLEKHLVFTLNNDGKLIIAMEGDFNGNRNSKRQEKFTAEITCSSLNAIQLSGACELDGIGKFNTDNLEIRLSGAAKMHINEHLQVKEEIKINLAGASNFSGQITTENINLHLSGASELTMTGVAQQGELESRGASKINLANVPMRKAIIRISGASSAHVNVSEELTATASGASKLTYSGTPRIKEINTSGASKVKAK